MFNVSSESIDCKIRASAEETMPCWLWCKLSSDSKMWSRCPLVATCDQACQAKISEFSECALNDILQIILTYIYIFQNGITVHVLCKEVEQCLDFYPIFIPPTLNTCKISWRILPPGGSLEIKQKRKMKNYKKGKKFFLQYEYSVNIIIISRKMHQNVNQMCPR